MLDFLELHGAGDKITQDPLAAAIKENAVGLPLFDGTPLCGEVRGVRIPPGVKKE